MRIGFVCGTFDFLHAGHIHMLKQCKRKCNYLIVGLHVDPSIERPEKNKPIESLLERQIKLRACRYVNQIIIYEKEDDLKLIFAYFKPDVRFLGSDYNLNKYKPITAKNSIPIEYINSIPVTSSILHERIKNGH